MRINERHGGKRAKRQVVRSDGTLYRSISEAARDNCCDAENIGLCCRGKRKSTAGYEWAYYEEASDAS